MIEDEQSEASLERTKDPSAINQAKEGSKKNKFSSCIHYYKRDLSPMKEMYPHFSFKTPYR